MVTSRLLPQNAEVTLFGVPPATEPHEITVDIFTDIVCPWCYVAQRQMEHALAAVPELSVRLRYRPFLLNPWLDPRGMARDAYLVVKFGSLERYARITEPVLQAGAKLGLNLRLDRITRQPDTVDCHRLIYWSEQNGDGTAMIDRLLRLFLCEGADLTDRDTLVAAAVDLGFDSEDIRHRLDSACDLDLIRAEADTAAHAGVEGVPTLVIGGQQAVFGAQSSAYLAMTLRQVARDHGTSIVADQAI